MKAWLVESFVKECRHGLITHLLTCGVVLAAVDPALADAATPQAGMHLTFESHFETLTGVPNNNNEWMTTGAGGWRTLRDNKEAQYYSDASVGINPFSVHDGVLTITASRGKNVQGLPYNSGMLTTYRSFSQLYGYFEMRARLPAGAGLWPAFWLLPADGSWPPEIDIMEQLGSEPHIIVVGSHSVIDGSNVATTTAIHVTDTSREFHVYGLDWEANEMTWYFDGKPIFRQSTSADLHTPMYLLINLAVGGRGSWPGPPARSTVFPARFQVDYLRVYSH